MRVELAVEQLVNISSSAISGQAEQGQGRHIGEDFSDAVKHQGSYWLRRFFQVNSCYCSPTGERLDWTRVSRQPFCCPLKQRTSRQICLGLNNEHAGYGRPPLQPGAVKIEMTSFPCPGAWLMGCSLKLHSNLCQVVKVNFQQQSLTWTDT
jgi:hypothetical protein